MLALVPNVAEEWLLLERHDSGCLWSCLHGAYFVVEWAVDLTNWEICGHILSTD